MDTLQGIFKQNKAQLFFFLGIGIVFSGLTVWMFLYRADIPDKLMSMTLSLWGFLWAGIEKGKDKMETMLNKDLDGDGVIGTNANATVQVAEVDTHDAECDASKYTV